MSYADFIRRKSQVNDNHGFEPLELPSFLYDFQLHLLEWAIRKGRAAIFADCGLGKTPMQLVWARNVARKTNGKVLILTPLAVASQTLREASKFGIEAEYSRGGEHSKNIVITNYERLHYFDWKDFAGVVCDESSCIKHFDAKRTGYITSFMRKLRYRLLCTATAAPNDFTELGTSSEALGYLGYQDMLGRFFKQENTNGHGWGRMKYRLKEQATEPFWRWICSWARVIRRPSDYGYSDDQFILPHLDVKQTIVKASRAIEGMLFVLPAHGLDEQRKERRQTIEERCEKVAELVNGNSSAVAWCHLNDEGDLLERLIEDGVQVSGKDSDDAKEEKLAGFQSGDIKRLVTKPRIAGWGLNWQHCHHMTMFPSHSFEQYYQAVRRLYRFGQTKQVSVDIVSTEGESSVLKSLQAKADQANEMFERLLENTLHELHIDRLSTFTDIAELPTWLAEKNS